MSIESFAFARNWNVMRIHDSLHRMARMVDHHIVDKAELDKLLAAVPDMEYECIGVNNFTFQLPDHVMIQERRPMLVDFVDNNSTIRATFDFNPSLHFTN